MTKAQITGRVIGILLMPGSHRDHFASCDLVDQDHLYEIQNALLQLADELDHEATKAAFPYLYQKSQEEATP